MSMAFMRVVVIAKDGWWACLRSAHQPSPVWQRVLPATSGSKSFRQRGR